MGNKERQVQYMQQQTADDWNYHGFYLTVLFHEKISHIIYRFASLSATLEDLCIFRTPDDTISSPKLCFLSAITAYHTNEDATCSEQFKLILLFLS